MPFPIWLKCRDANRRHSLIFISFFPLSVKAAKLLPAGLTLVLALPLSTSPRFHRGFHSHIRRGTQSRGRSWHRAGHMLGTGHPGCLSHSTAPVLREMLRSTSLLKRDSGSGTKITVICHSDCSLYIDFRT